MMKSITMLMDSGRTYSEDEINELLQQWNLEVDEPDLKATVAAYRDYRERRRIEGRERKGR